MLIITADDYGVTEGVSRGIIEAIEGGMVKCVSVLMNYVTADDIIQLGKAVTERDEVGVGLHINLTEGKSLTTRRTFDSSLLNDLDFVRREMEAQVAAFKETFGEIDHINFHQHIHYDLRVMEQYLSISSIADFPVRFVNKTMRAILIDHKRKVVDRFVNVFPLNAEPESFESHLEVSLSELLASPNCVTEWMVHPGYSCRDLEELAPNYCIRREEELRLLTRPYLTERFLDEVPLVNFADAFA